MKKSREFESIPDQVKVALDGRTQRWLALEIKIPESVLSKKMSGEVMFTDADVNSINKRLKCNIRTH
jgi:hypothetical protein